MPEVSCVTKMLPVPASMRVRIRTVDPNVFSLAGLAGDVATATFAGVPACVRFGVTSTVTGTVPANLVSAAAVTSAESSTSMTAAIGRGERD